MAYDEGLAQRVRESLIPRDLVEKEMFGGIGFLLNGNVVCWSSDFCAGLDQDQPVDNLNVIVSLHEVRKETESTMPTQKPPRISLPKGWPSYVKSGVLHIISLAHFSITHVQREAGSFLIRRSFIDGVQEQWHARILDSFVFESA